MGLRVCPVCRRTFARGAASCPEHGRVLREDNLVGTLVAGHRVTGWLAPDLYAATDRRSGAALGLRIVDPTGTDLDQAGLLAELRTASALSDGAALQPLEGGSLADGRLFYTFAWPRRGQVEPLRHRLERAPRPLRECLDIGVALCRAVAAAHRAGLVHGLLGGETVLVHDGAELTLGLRVHLLDLGLSRRLLGGPPQDPLEDVRAIGTLLYQLATGSPVQGPTAFAEREDLPAEFEAVVLRALAGRKEDRHPSVTVLQKDLEALQQESRRTPPPAPSRAVQLLPLLVAGTAGVALAAIVLLVVLGQPSSSGPPPPVASPAGAAPPRTDPVPGLEGLCGRAMGVLAEATRSLDARERQGAAQIIGQSGDPRLRPLAEDLLVDADPQVAGQAAWALGQLHDRAAVVALMAAGRTHPIDLEVGVSLLQLGELRGLDLLRAVLRSRPERERMEAALWLGENNEPEAWRVLRRMLAVTQDQDPHRHIVLLGRLCRGRDQAACQQLRERLEGRAGAAGLRGRARLLAGIGLMEAGDPRGFQVLREVAGAAELRLPALRALAETGLEPDEEQWLVERAGSSAPLPERVLALEALGRAAVPAVQVLQQALASKEAELRWAAAAAVLRLCRLQPDLLRERAIQWAAVGLFSQGAPSRAAAAAILSTAPPQLAVPLLISALGDRDAEVRSAAASALGEIGAAASRPEVIAALRQALEDREGMVRVAAVQALGRIEEPAVRALLLDQIARGGLVEQVAAAGVLLRQEGSHRHVLRQALGTPDVALRLLAVRELLHDPDRTERHGLLLVALNDAADDVRLTAAIGLAQLEDSRAVEALREHGGLLLAQRLLARDALMRLKVSVPSLDIVAALGAAGEGQRASAMAAAGQLLPETALNLLRRGLRDVAPTVRLAAVGAIAEAALPQRTRQQLLRQAAWDADPAVQARAAALLAALSAGPRTRRP
ncbi:MAG: HEAT repeat domain-containing protein [Myxococcota bacterium]|nr:HEAT repeat domain-containing protein [Myxococcota bacterium]